MKFEYSGPTTSNNSIFLEILLLNKKELYTKGKRQLSLISQQDDNYKIIIIVMFEIQIEIVKQGIFFFALLDTSMDASMYQVMISVLTYLNIYWKEK